MCCPHNSFLRLCIVYRIAIYGGIICRIINYSVLIYTVVIYSTGDLYDSIFTKVVFSANRQIYSNIVTTVSMPAYLL